MDQDYNKYDEKVMDLDEVEGTDVKINPDYYIHKALLKAQDALNKDNIKEGFLQYRQFIEHIEVLCDSAGMLGEEYEESIKEFKESQIYKDADRTVQSMRLCNEKLRHMMKEIFTHKTATFNLKL